MIRWSFGGEARAEPVLALGTAPVLPWLPVNSGSVPGTPRRVGDQPRRTAPELASGSDISNPIGPHSFAEIAIYLVPPVAWVAKGATGSGKRHPRICGLVPWTRSENQGSERSFIEFRV